MDLNLSTTLSNANPVINLSIISFNINGIVSPSSQSKFRTIHHIIKHMHTQIILLQEIRINESQESLLSTHFPNFHWYCNTAFRGKWGVAIGLRRSLFQGPLIPLKDPWGTFIGLPINLQGNDIFIGSFYMPHNPDSRKLSYDFLFQIPVPTNHRTIIGGDFNQTPNEKIYQKLANHFQKHDISFLPNPFPSRANSNRTIDHFLFSNTQSAIRYPSIYAFPPPAGDHSPLILTLKRQKKQHTHNIPPYIADHPAFIQAIKDTVPKFKDWQGTPFDYLKLTVSTAHNTHKSWNNSPQPSPPTQKIHMINDLTNLLNQALNQKLIPLHSKSLIHKCALNHFIQKHPNSKFPHRYVRKKYRAEYTNYLRKLLTQHLSKVPPTPATPPLLFDQPQVAFPTPKSLPNLEILSEDTLLPLSDPKQIS